MTDCESLPSPVEILADPTYDPYSHLLPEAHNKNIAVCSNPDVLLSLLILHCQDNISYRLRPTLLARLGQE